MGVKKVAFEFKIDLSGIERSKRNEAAKAVADFVHESILSDADNGISSVSGRHWKGLSSAYKLEKGKQSSSVKANLELTGALLDSLESSVDGSKVSVGFFDAHQVPKADGHNNFSGDSNLPLRQSIPKPGQNFRPGIREGIKEILNEYEQASVVVQED